MITQIRAHILKYRTLKLMEKTTGSMLFVSRYKLRKTWFIDCSSNRLTPEETILYFVSETCKEADNYYDCEHLKIGVLSDKHADLWFFIAKGWECRGLVKPNRLEEFVNILNSAKSRWPELFSGKSPYIRKYWEVHFNYMPDGVATIHPTTKPVAMFDEFADATKYVEDNSTVDYWWHSYDLFEAARNRKIPEWEAMPTPQQFNRIDKPGYVGYNSIRHESADCIFATPRDSYMKWLSAVIEGDIYKGNEIRNGFIVSVPRTPYSQCIKNLS